MDALQQRNTRRSSGVEPNIVETGASAERGTRSCSPTRTRGQSLDLGTRTRRCLSVRTLEEERGLKCRVSLHSYAGRPTSRREDAVMPVFADMFVDIR
jgi:hypothetical protein